MEVEDLRKIYESTENWLKFVEAKLIAFLTFETGLSYFIFKTDIFSKLGIVSQVVFVIALCSAIALLVWNVLPRTNNRSNPLYYHSWLNTEIFGTVTEKDYQQQIKDLAVIIEKKSKGIKYSILAYSFGMGIFLVGTIMSIGGLL